MKIFLDANVLFSMSNKQSPMYEFFEGLLLRSDLCTCHYTLAETQRNLVEKRPVWHKDFLGVLDKITIVEDGALEEEVVLNEKDRPVLGSAILAHCDYLLTGDKRGFGHLFGKTVGGVEIVSYMMLTSKFE